MPRRSYLIRPLQHGLNTELPALHIPGENASGMQNCRTFEGAIQNRWGYNTADRSLGQKVYNIILFTTSDGTRNTVYLGETDAMVKQTGGSNTFSYITPTYTTGTITSIAGAVVTGDSTGWSASTNLAAGDKFIMNDDHSSSIEPDTNWATIKSIDSGTQITLTASYGTSAATFPGAAYTGRMLYSLPANNRWSYASVNDILFFANGNEDVQQWTGSSVASAVDSTNAKKARYCIEYASRLVMADLIDVGTGTRDPYLVKYSKNGAPTTLVDSTAGQVRLIQTEDFISGLGRVGSNLVVYKMDSIILGEMSGESTSPIYFSTQKRGVGCVAPWSIVEVLGTNAWIWRDDFYILSGQEPIRIPKSPRNRFFDIVDKTEVERTWGAVNAVTSEAMWFANSSEGLICEIWNFKDNEWYESKFAAEVNAVGKGAL